MTYYRSIVGWLFTRLYHEFAWLYDLIATLVSWGHWQAWVLAISQELRGDILELGCGTGYLQAHLQGRAARHTVLGIDRSRQMLRLTRKRCMNHGLHPQLMAAQAEHMPISAQRFDTIVATFPSEYILRDATLAEIRRLLRPDGQLLVVLSASLPGPGWYRALVELAYRLTLQAGVAQEPSASAPVAELPFAIQKRLSQADLDGQPLILDTRIGTLFGIVATPIAAR